MDIRANVVFIVNTEIEPLLEIAIKEAEVNNPSPDENPIVTHAKKLQLEFQISKFYSDDNQPKNIVNCMKLITQELKEPIFDVRKNFEKQFFKMNHRKNRSLVKLCDLFVIFTFWFYVYAETQFASGK